MRYRQDVETAEYTRAKNLAGSHMRAWHGAWNARTLERNRMKKSVGFMINNAISRAMASWTASAREAAAAKAGLERAYRRWRNRELHAAFSTALVFLSEEAAALDKARRGLSKLCNRALNMGFVTWEAFATVRWSS